MISKMFNLAEMWGLRPDGSNPRKHIKKYPEEKRERFLSQQQASALNLRLCNVESVGGDARKSKLVHVTNRRGTAASVEDSDRGQPGGPEAPSVSDRELPRRIGSRRRAFLRKQIAGSACRQRK
jgi:hypothetical protein